jgi:hypothetical protein
MPGVGAGIGLAVAITVGLGVGLEVGVASGVGFTTGETPGVATVLVGSLALVICRQTNFRLALVQRNSFPLSRTELPKVEHLSPAFTAAFAELVAGSAMVKASKKVKTIRRANLRKKTLGPETRLFTTF